MGRRRLESMRAIAMLLGVILVVPAFAQERTPIFVFHTDDFWLNLHHFLYVLGRHENESPDRTRRATVDAPADATRGLATLTPEEQGVWKEAVTFYARGLSRQEVAFAEPLVELGAALARAAASVTLNPTGIEPSVFATLQRAAPFYRKAWWPAHLRASRTQEAELQRLVDRHGAAVVAFLTRAYGFPWNPGGYPVHISAYSNWAGAFSTSRQVLVMSSLHPGNAGELGLEIVFHEAMHQWEMYQVLQAEAKRQGTTLPNQLPHALIFYTAGEAIRSVVPGHVPSAVVERLWDPKGLGAFSDALETVWKPYLDGKGTRDEAISELIRRSR